jgi:hypothetical protein
MMTKAIKYCQEIYSGLRRSAEAQRKKNDLEE